MSSFEEIFCERHHCSSKDFGRRVFWRCLHRRALPVAPLIIAFNPGYFFHDRDLVSRIRRAEKMNHVWEELREYFVHPQYQGWMRRRANIRLSGRRIIELAKQYLPASNTSPPPPYSLPEREQTPDAETQNC